MEWVEARHRLGVAEMDATHREFMERVNGAAGAAGAAFAPAFAALCAHTERHFATEERWMAESAFAARGEHLDEHRRVLRDLRRFNERIAKGSSTMARAYLKEQVGAWFELHAATMDAALAAHLKARAAA